MRILVVQESDWMAKGPHQSHHLMERLSTRGHEIRVIDYEIRWRDTASNGIVSRRRIFTGVSKSNTGGNVTVIRPMTLRLPLLDYVSLAFSHRKEIQRQIEEFHPDVVIGFGILNAHIALALARKRGIPFIYYIIDELHLLIPQKFLIGVARLCERNNMANADEVLCINEGLRLYSIEMGASAQRTSILRAGVDLGRFDSGCFKAGRDLRRKYGIMDDEVVLFFMGWVYSFSGLKDVAQQIADSQANKIRYRLLIIGEGDSWNELLEFRAKNGLEDSIIMERWRPYDEVPKYIMASDICILPAQLNDIMTNIVPIKMYEYMAAGKPVIATRFPGLEKEFGEGNGVEYVDQSSSILKKAGELLEKNALISVGRSAREFVQTQDWEGITDQFETSLRRIAAREHPSEAMAHEDGHREKNTRS